MNPFGLLVVALGGGMVYAGVQALHHKGLTAASTGSGSGTTVAASTPAKAVHGTPKIPTVPAGQVLA